MTQAQKAHDFAGLHVAGDPLVLYNIWDAGSAKAVADAGAKAVATGSWSVAAAQGYSDGQAIPLTMLLQIASRIAATVDIPVTIDFEGGYAEAPEDVAANVARLIGTGAIGINFEDQVVGGSGLHSTEFQCERIAAVRRASDAEGVPLFINARTDLFLKEKDRAKHPDLLAEAKARGAAYAASGASGFFVPGLVDRELIGAICAAATVPVNVMMMGGAPTVSELAAAGVGRVSHGPGPYIEAMSALGDRFRALAGSP